MRTELYSVRSSAEEISFLNKNLRKIVTALNKRCSVRVLYKTEIDYNPRKIKADLIDSLSADNPPEFYIYVNALESQNSSSFRYLFSPLIERLEKELPQGEYSEDGSTPLYAHIRVFPLENLPGSYPAYCFIFKNKKVLALPRINLAGGDLTEYICDAVNCAKEIFDRAFTECPDGYVFTTEKPVKKNILTALFAKKQKAEEPVAFQTAEAETAQPSEAEGEIKTPAEETSKAEETAIPAEETVPQESSSQKNADSELDFMTIPPAEKDEIAETTPHTIVENEDTSDASEKAYTSDTEESAQTEKTDSEENEETAERKGGFKAFLASVFPMKGDSTRTLLSKWVVLVFSVVFLVGAYLLLNFYVIEPWINNSDITDIQNIFYETQPEQTDAQGNVIVSTQDEKPLKNWAGLAKINKEIVGWVKLDKTKIDYPVLFHKEDSAESQFYLYKNYKKEYSEFGSIFMDYRCTEGANSKNVILHGHNMGSDDSMFGSLIQYARYKGWVQGNTKFYKSAPTVNFDTPEGDAQWVVFAVMKIDVSNENKAIFNYLLGDFSSDAQFMNFVYNIKERSYLDVPVPVNADDRLLTLSTCSYESDNMRTVVVARMVREGEDVSKYVSKVKKVTPVSTVTSSFLTEYDAGNIKWYDSKERPEGDESLEYMEQAEMYTVKFVDAKGKTIASQQVLKGKDATAPTGEAPRKASDKTYYYTFKGWSPSFKNVTKDLTIKPVFNKHLRPVTETTTRATDPPEPQPVVTQAPANPPANPPTQAPTKAPTNPPTQAPDTQAPTTPATTLPADPVEASSSQ